MARSIFVNLPVGDLDRSIAFFRALGFEFDERFTDATATCMIVAEGIYVMLLTHGKFRSFTPNEICDTASATEVLVALSADSRAEIDDLVQRAVSAGGAIYSQPQDHGFMYQHGFRDPDGHVWELIYMDNEAMAQA